MSIGYSVDYNTTNIRVYTVRDELFVSQIAQGLCNRGVVTYHMTITELYSPNETEFRFMINNEFYKYTLTQETIANAGSYVQAFIEHHIANYLNGLGTDTFEV